MDKSQIETLYQLSKEVYDHCLSLKEAKEIGALNNINPNSTSYHCSCFRHMLNGTKFSGSISVEARDYFLSKIFETYGDQVKKNSIISFEMTNLYNEKRKNCTLYANRAVLEKYKKML